MGVEKMPRDGCNTKMSQRRVGAIAEHGVNPVHFTRVHTTNKPTNAGADGQPFDSRYPC